MFAYTIGDVLVVKQPYIQNTLSKADPVIVQGSRALNIRRAVEALASLGLAPVTVADTGELQTFLPNQGSGIQNSGVGGTVQRIFARLIPTDITHSLYNAGFGVVVYWELADSTTFNDAFELSKSTISKPECGTRVFNNSGLLIVKGSVLRITSYDTTQQINNVGLADATTIVNSAIFGMAEADIQPNAIGTALVEGTVSGLDTSAFQFNALVFLSDTPGQISPVAGTISVLLGRVLCDAVAPNGVINIVGNVPLLGGLGGGGATGLIGDTGITGATGLGPDEVTPGVQARRTTQLALPSGPGAWTDVDLDTTDIENNAPVIDHNPGVNPDRINIHQDGDYRVIVNALAAFSSTVSEVAVRVRLNDTSTIVGTEGGAAGDMGGKAHISREALVALSAGDFVTLQGDELVGVVTLEPETKLIVQKLVGGAGSQGVTGTGVPGATGIQPAFQGETGIQGIMGIDGATGIQGITGLGAGAAPTQRDAFSGALANGQTVFNLSMTPSDITLVGLEINGVVYRSTSFITVVGTTLTWLNAFAVASTDAIDAVYPV
jgi:hypothetical protein